MTSMLLKASSLIFGLAALSFTSLASAGPAPGSSGGQKVCTYSTGLTSLSYRSARVSYPCTISGKAPATTLTGGFTNTKEDMYWLADHLSSHGFIVIAITPTNNLGLPPGWERAHKGGIDKLKSENSRIGSAIRNKVDTSKLGIMGFSMGGGGTLLAAADLGTQIKTAVPLAPWLGASIPAYRNIKAKTLVISGASDSVAFPATIAGYYRNLPAITKGLAEVRGASRLAEDLSGWRHQLSDLLQRLRPQQQRLGWLVYPVPVRAVSNSA
jgi:dienelactone hydrolase